MLLCHLIKLLSFWKATWLCIFSANERRPYICNVSSYWMGSCSKKWLLSATAVVAMYDTILCSRGALFWWIGKNLLRIYAVKMHRLACNRCYISHAKDKILDFNCTTPKSRCMAKSVAINVYVWHAAVLQANWKPGLKILLINMDFKMEFPFWKMPHISWVGYRKSRQIKFLLVPRFFSLQGIQPKRNCYAKQCY